MRTTVESVGDVEVKVDVEIPAAEVDREYARQLTRVRTKARIKGFRPGKAPKAMVQRMYAQQLAQDTAVELMQATADDALGQVERSVVGQPRFEPAVARPGEAMTYTIRVQAKPVVKLTNWKGIEVSAAPAIVPEGALEAEVARLQGSQKERVPVDDRGADIGDILVIDTHGSLDGESDERLHVHDMEVTLGSEGLIPGFGDQLMGATSGEKRTIEVTFPKDWSAEDMKGKPAVFEIEVKGHFVDELPELDDDFAQDVGHDSMDALRASLGEKLTATAQDRRKQEAQEKIVDVVLERTPFQPPPALVQAQLDHTARRYVTMLMMQGVPQDEAMEILKSSGDGLARDAQRAVRRYLALEALAEQDDITIDDDAVDAEIVARIQRQGPRAGEQFEKEEGREALRAELREAATLDLLVSHATITDAVDAPDEEGAAGDSDPGSDPDPDPDSETEDGA